MKTTRTFKDLDLNFTPAPSSQDRYNGVGTIACATNSIKVYGYNTTFQYSLAINDNLYFNSIFVGKVKSIESNTELTLYANCRINSSMFAYTIGSLSNSTLDITTVEITDSIIVDTINDDVVISTDMNSLSGTDIDLSVDIIDTLFNTLNIDMIDTTDASGNIITENIQLYDDKSIAFSVSASGLADGTLIPYKIYGVQYQDVYVDDSNPLYTNIGGYIVDESSSITGSISGNLVVTNNKSSLQLTLLSAIQFDTRPVIVLELVGNAFATVNIDYSYSTPSDVAIKYDASAIKSAVKNLILTMNYERPFNSALGSQVRAIMFEPASPMTEVLLRRSIIDVITSYEPRVVLLDLVINMNSDTLSANITIYFQIINTTEPLKLDLVLERVR